MENHNTNTGIVELTTSSKEPLIKGGIYKNKQYWRDPVFFRTLHLENSRYLKNQVKELGNGNLSLTPVTINLLVASPDREEATNNKKKKLKFR